MSSIIPIPRIAITVRPGTMDDLPFIDRLQKMHSKMLGFMPTKALEGKIKAGHVLVADGRVSGVGRRVSGEENPTSALDPNPDTRTPKPDLLGYLIGNDQYFKRDDCGIIYQINIAPGKQRGFIGAALLKAQFERSAYGCKLYCCWCAQDLEANRFWEACGFVPLAFRAGSEKKRRVHIFWCKRIREGDCTTPWWFPSETKGGSMMEDRLVFPIPPGKKWSDEMPIVLPRHTLGRHTVQKQIEEGGAKRVRKKAARIVAKRGPLCGGLMFENPASANQPGTAITVHVEKPKPAKKEKIRNDPKFVSAARELRDRWLEKVSEDPSLISPRGKYDVNKPLSSPSVHVIAALPTLPALPASVAA